MSLKSDKATISFVLSVRPSTWDNSAVTGWIFMKFDIRVFFEKPVEKVHASLKSDKATVSFVLSVRPSAWDNSAVTGWIFMVFDI